MPVGQETVQEALQRLRGGTGQETVRDALARLRGEGVPAFPTGTTIEDFMPALERPPDVFTPPDVTSVADIRQGLPREQAGLQALPDPFEVAPQPEPDFRQATIGLDPQVGLFGRGFPDPTAGLIQENPNVPTTGSISPSYFERAFVDISEVKRPRIPIERDVDYEPPVIAYGPKAGIVGSFLRGEGFPVNLEQVRRERDRSAAGEFIGGLSGEAIKYAYLARAFGGAGLTGAYPWVLAGSTSGFLRGVNQGKTAGEIVTTPEMYIEASLAGSPFVIGKAARLAAGPLSRKIRRPVQTVAGEPFFRKGKILRTGEPPTGKPIELLKEDLVNPDAAFSMRSPAKKVFEQFKKGASKFETAARDKAAQLLDREGAAASAFLVKLNEDILGAKEAVATAKDHFFGASKFLWQAQNRGKEPEFKQLMAGVQTMMEREHLYSGMFLEDLRDAGIRGWNGKQVIPGTKIRNDGVALKTMLESDNVIASDFRTILDKAHALAEQKGVNVSGYRGAYFPRMIKHEVATEMADDVQTIIGRKAAAYELNIDLPQNQLNRLSKITQSWANRKVNKKRNLSVALRHIIDDPTNGIDNYGDALFYMRKQTYEDLFNPFGNLERPRIIDLPDGFYEPDAKKVLPRYLRGVGRRIATVETFGPNGDKASNLLKALHERNPHEAEIAKQIMDSWSGRINSDRLTGVGGRRLKKILSASTEFEVVSKIGFGFATIPNITQIPISAAVEAGWLRTVRGGIDMLSKANRSKVRRSGVLLDTAQDAILGYNTEGSWSAFRNRVLTASGFAPINKVNQYWSAGIGKQYVEDLYRLANRGAPTKIATPDLPGVSVEAAIPKIAGARTEWAKRKLSQYGIDYRAPLTDETKSRFMWRFANETQLQKNVLREPIAANDPRFRWMFLFKKFGLKQAQLIRERVWNEIRVNDNPLPLLRLGAAGYAGGEFVGFAKNKISTMLTGEDYYRESERGTWERMIENIASVGGFGVMGDLTSTVTENLVLPEVIKKKNFQRAIRGLKFLGLPVQAQTMGDLYTFVESKATKVMADIDDPVAWREVTADAMKLLGTVGRRLSARVETPGQKQNRLKARRSRKLEEVRDLAVVAENSTGEKSDSLWNEIERTVDLWNTAHPDLWIDIQRDVEKGFEKRLERKEIRKEERLFPPELKF